MLNRAGRPAPLAFLNEKHGPKGQGAPAFHDALRVTPGSGNPPDAFRWTLHSLWFAVLTRPGCPSLSARGAGTVRPPLAAPEPLGRSCDSTTSKALSAAAWWLPLGQPFSTAGAAERLTAAAGRLAPCLARPPKYMRTAPARHPTHGCHCRSLVGVVTPIATVTEAVQRPSAQPVGWLITRSLWAAASTPTLSRYAVSVP